MLRRLFGNDETLASILKSTIKCLQLSDNSPVSVNLVHGGKQERPVRRRTAKSIGAKCASRVGLLRGQCLNNYGKRDQH